MVNAKEAATSSRSSRILPTARGQGGQDRRREVLGAPNTRREISPGTEGSSGTGEKAKDPEATKSEVIYALLNANGAVFYVGRTSNIKQRMRKHRVTFGEHTTFQLLQQSFANTTPAAAESYWIAHYASLTKSGLVNVRIGNKNKAINIRLRWSEKELFDRAADSEHQSLSDWFRRLGRKRLAQLEKSANKETR